MKIAICDDQRECRNDIRYQLKEYFTQNQIHDNKITEYASGMDLLEAYSPGVFDVIFLDIQMPGINGEDTAGRIRNLDLNVDIVFVTNMKDQSLMGYNYNAKGFLIKKVAQTQMNKLMDRLRNEMSRRTDIGSYAIAQKFDEGIVHLQLSNVYYFESYDKYICAVTSSGKHEFRGQLKTVEKDLCGKGFLRINRSLLINMSHVFKNFRDEVVLNTGESLPIGKSYKIIIRDAFKDKKVVF